MDTEWADSGKLTLQPAGGKTKKESLRPTEPWDAQESVIPDTSARRRWKCGKTNRLFENLRKSQITRLPPPCYMLGMRLFTFLFKWLDLMLLKGLKGGSLDRERQAQGLMWKLRGQEGGYILTEESPHMPLSSPTPSTGKKAATLQAGRWARFSGNFVPCRKRKPKDIHMWVQWHSPARSPCTDAQVWQAPTPTPCSQSCQSPLQCLFLDHTQTAKEHKTFAETRKTKAKTSKQKRGRPHEGNQNRAGGRKRSPETVAPGRYESDAIFNKVDNRKKFWEIKNERRIEKLSRKLERLQLRKYPRKESKNTETWNLERKDKEENEGTSAGVPMPNIGSSRKRTEKKKHSVTCPRTCIRGRELLEGRNHLRIPGNR